MQSITPTPAIDPVEVIALVNAICDLADEAENKGLNFTQTSLRWVAMSLAQDIDAPQG